jgi:hypothetical protein
MYWKDTFRAALIEIDPAKQLNLIHDAQQAMTLRSESLPKISSHELDEMNDATRTLQILKSHAQAGRV